MNRQPFEKPPRWWSPKLSRRWIRFWRPFRIREQKKNHRLLEIDVHGVQYVRQALDEGCGILITPNHSSHADSFPLYEAADRIGCPLYIMAAWQVFARSGWLKRMILRQHGSFSVDREGTDLTALRQARAVLESESCPLVIFPEGEVYHVNDRITPFREGPAAVALMAARKVARPIVCIPCAMKYHYIQDPTAELTALMSDLEEALLWRPRPDLTLQQRVYHFGEGVLALKEIEFLGQTSSGPVSARIANLIEFLLGRIEARYGIDSPRAAIPERIKAARKAAINQLQELPDDDPARRRLYDDLDDLFLVVQAFSYPGDYVMEHPTVERLAETLDKFEEDVLGVQTATIRGARKATVIFSEPIRVPAKKGQRMTAAELTRTLESRVTKLLGEGFANASRPNK